MRPLHTPQQFVDAVRQAGLVDPHRLRAFVLAAQGAGELTVDRLGELAAGADLLTRFQAREVIAGRADQLTLRNYRLIEKLGSGGMGDVYLGVDLRTGERRAIKVLAAALHHDPVARRRLEREARAAAALDHPNIVRVHEFDCHSTRHPPYLVMEYVDGVSLQAAVAVAGTFSTAAAAECGRQVAGGLEHAWNAKLVHRDIKPANLLLDRGGRVKVLDLGVVRWVEEVGLTNAGKDGRRLLGTVDYLAPEQALDSSSVDCRADVYSLGGTLYFLLAGHPPFLDDNPARRLLRKQREDPPPVHTLRPDVPTDLSRVIARMLARRVEDRFPTPADAAAALAPFVADGGVCHAALFARIDRGGGEPADEQGPSTVAGAHRPNEAAHPRTGAIAVLNQAKAGSTAEFRGIRPFLRDADTPPPAATQRMTPFPKPAPAKAATRRAWVGVAVGVLTVAALALLTFVATR